VSALDTVTAAWYEALAEINKKSIPVVKRQLPDTMDFVLTVRQHRVLDAIVASKGPKQIAGELGISVSTAKWHGWQIAKRLGYPSVTVLRKFHSK
jgi:DNA-binding CsgD family transcriptional regulator